MQSKLKIGDETYLWYFIDKRLLLLTNLSVEVWETRTSQLVLSLGEQTICRLVASDMHRKSDAFNIGEGEF